MSVTISYSSFESSQSAVDAFDITCSTVVAPAITELTTPLFRSQAKARSNTDLPRSLPNDLRFSINSKFSSVNTPLSSD